MPKGKRVTNLPVDEIIQLYTIEHISYENISKRYNAGTATIRKVLCDNNIPVSHTKNIDNLLRERGVLVSIS